MASKTATKAAIKQQQYESMTKEELAAATAQFDQEFAIDQSTELPPAMAEQWERAKRKRGRPKIGKGVKVISVSLEQQLLRDADKLAKRIGFTRAALISMGLGMVLGKLSKRREDK